ncbi:MAG: DNA polymerase III subunit delta', partial [Dolichospermum sp.]
QYYWQQIHEPKIIQQLEKTRKHLLCYAQPRLVWECTFLALFQISQM